MNWAEAELTAVEGRKLTFAVSAYDQREKIGGGTHERFIIKKRSCAAFARSFSVCFEVELPCRTPGKPPCSRPCPYRKLTFAVSAYDQRERIGGGTHERFIIKPEKFLARAQAKG